MTWDVTDLGVPDGAVPAGARGAGPARPALVDDLLARHGLIIGDVDGWAVHPGGPKILDVVQEQLGLAAGGAGRVAGGPGAYGNCSSPTVLLVLERLRRRPGRRAGW